MSRLPDYASPLTDEGYAKSLYHSAGWPWLVEYISGQITQAKDELASGVSDWDQYQKLIGLIEGLPKAIDRVNDLVEDEDGRAAE